MSKYTQVVILCEDLQQEVFTRTFLVQCGIPGPRIRTVPLPKEGAGESFVRRQYPQEVSAYRQRMHKMNLGLAVMIDADNHLVEEHFVELDQALREAGLLARQPNEKIGIFIPRRNIETWIHYLMGQAVNEEDAYPYLKQESDCKPVVQALARNRREPLPEIAPPSLKTACQELPRIIPEDA